MTKNCQICSFCQIFVTFMKLFLSEFKYILNFDTFLPHFLAIFVSFLTHFGFWHIFVRFMEIFDSYLSQFCVLTHFWQIFVNFCYIFDTFLKWRDLHWQPVPKFMWEKLSVGPPSTTDTDNYAVERTCIGADESIIKVMLIKLQLQMFN